MRPSAAAEQRRRHASPTSPRRPGCSTRSTPTPRAWADYDNDGWLDLFIGCEHQPNRLYHNRGDGTFEEVAAKAGVAGRRPALLQGLPPGSTSTTTTIPTCSSTICSGDAQLYHNNRNGTFTDVTAAMGIDGPADGLFVLGLGLRQRRLARHLRHLLRPLARATWSRACSASRTADYSNRLFRNLNGKGFEDKTKEAGLDMVFATMGSNFGDFDNDGFLDMYLGTGDPDLATLIPNRMFKNVGGQRFAEITASSGTGHLQKGHGVACGDWDRDGDVDIFIEMGGAVNGDKYHNILFQNPGQGNHWLTVKLVGKKTNRAAIGARIKVVTAGEKPLTVHRHVSSGSSFGANPLQQTIGLAKADRVAAPGDPLADQRDDPGLPRHRRRPGHRGDRVRRRLPEARLETDPAAEVNSAGLNGMN